MEMMMPKPKPKKIDRLFLEKDCPDCGAIRGVLDFEAVTRDDFRGSRGQALHVFSSLSNEASLELLKKFDLASQGMPVMVSHDGEIIGKTDRLIAYLTQNNMVVK